MTDKYINPSGFAENLPAEQLVEDTLKTIIQDQAEAYGYNRLETSSVEYMDTLASSGDINKEIYTIGRAMSEGEEGDSSSARGLHFDLTIPFARYVAQNQGSLEFPFRRYQIQKVWRGERPQKGRFREFYQADIDVVARETLLPYFDAEIATVMARILNSFGIGNMQMNINNRKFLNGLFELYGLQMTAPALQAIDKLDKIGESGVRQILCDDLQLDSESVDKLFTMITSTISQSEVEKFLLDIPVGNELLTEGKEELRQLFAALPKEGSLANISFVLNPSIARGLDYYTGTVYETFVVGLEKYGSVCSGGRYTDLASRFTSQKLPGVGLSIGLTRLLSIIKEEKLADFTSKTKTDLTVCLLNDDQRTLSRETSDTLRQSGLNVEMNQKANVALAKQLATTESKGISMALVCEADGKFTLYKIGGDKEVFVTLSDLQSFLDKNV